MKSMTVHLRPCTWRKLHRPSQGWTLPAQAPGSAHNECKKLCEHVKV